MKKRVLNVLIAASLAASMLVGSGCTPKNSTNSGTSSGTNSTAKTGEEASTTPYGKYSSLVTYTLGKRISSDPRMPSGDTYEDNAYTRYIKDKANIQNKNAFEVNAGSAYDQKVSLSIASGSIPDVMFVNDLSTLKQLVDNDLIADLSKAYKDCASPKIKEIFDSYGGRSINQATFNNKLMALPSTNIGAGPNLLWVRKDWMDKLGLKAPKTLDDVENIIQQFIQKDPGGNGPGKTLGLAVASGVGGSYGSQYMLDSIFALYGAYPKQWMKDSSGKVYYGTVAPEMKNALAKIASMYKAGEIDQQFAVRTNDDINAQIINGKIGIFFGPWWSGKTPLMEQYKLNNKIVWEPYIAPVDSNGKLKQYTQNPCAGFIVVKKEYEHPEVVMKITNLLFDYSRYIDKDPVEINKYTSLGVSRVAMPLDINIDYDNAVALAYHHISDALEKKMDPSSLMSFEKSLYDDCFKYLSDPASATPASWANYNSRITGSKLIEDPAIMTVNPAFFGQTSTMKLKWANLQKLEQESLLKIILGEEPVSNFDNFVNTWKQTGGEQITKEVNEDIKK